jgi:hypothetical protein
MYIHDAIDDLTILRECPWIVMPLHSAAEVVGMTTEELGRE